MKINKNNYNNNRGFTFIEIILAASVVAFLSATMFRIISVSDTHRGLILKAEEVKSAMRLAQTYALSIPPDHSSRVVCGYGVMPVSNKLEVYYLYNNDYANNPGYCNNIITGNTVTLFSVDLTGYTIPSTTVFFQVPYGKVYWGNSETTGSTIRNYSITKGGASKTISITAGGKIDM